MAEGMRPPDIRYAPHAQLSLIIETLLTRESIREATVRNPWDAWWISYRLAQPAPALGLNPAAASHSCPACRAEASRLSSSRPPRHTQTRTDPRPCECLHQWSVAMRSPAPPLLWPRTRLALALIKPGALSDTIVGALAEHYRILSRTPARLRRVDVRRMYPEAYGADFVAARDTYLTSGPAEVMVLVDEIANIDPAVIKARIRSRFPTDRLRNHLHMSDNPGETFADIAHLVGFPVLTDLYDAYERDLAPRRLEYYRTVLGHQPSDAHRLQPRTT